MTQSKKILMLSTHSPARGSLFKTDADARIPQAYPNGEDDFTYFPTRNTLSHHQCPVNRAFTNPVKSVNANPFISCGTMEVENPPYGVRRNDEILVVAV